MKFPKISEMTTCPNTKKPINREYCKAHCPDMATSGQTKRNYHVCLYPTEVNKP